MAPDKPSVLILTPFYEPNVGGVETHLKDLTDYLKKQRKYRVYVLTYQPITTKAKGAYFERDRNVEIIRIPWVGFNLFHKLEPYPILEFLYITPWLFICAFIFLFLRGKRIKVIHAQGFNAAFMGKFLSGIFSKKLVVSTHAIYEMPQKSLMAGMVKWTLSSADKILTLSQAARRELVKIGLDRSRIDTYTYWIDQEIFRPVSQAAAKEQVGWRDKFLILFVGRLIEIKGTDILLQLAGEVQEDIAFAFIGDGPLAEKIKRDARKMRNVSFVGRVDNCQLPQYYNAADVLCVPSKYEEGFGRVLLEALSCGTPVIASNRGGIPEAVDNSVGVLVEPTASDFYRAILGFYNDKEGLGAKRKVCRNYAMKKFGTANADKILSSYG